MENERQGLVFLWMLAAGGGVALLFDIYRLLRRLWRWGRYATLLGDAAYCVLASGVLAAVGLAANGGEWRFYVWLAIGLGIMVYYRGCSTWVLRVGWWILAPLKRIGRWVGKKKH